jgi:hypothetical protein
MEDVFRGINLYIIHSVVGRATVTAPRYIQSFQSVAGIFMSAEGSVPGTLYGGKLLSPKQA